MVPGHNGCEASVLGAPFRRGRATNEFAKGFGGLLPSARVAASRQLGGRKLGLAQAHGAPLEQQPPEPSDRGTLVALRSGRIRQTRRPGRPLGIRHGALTAPLAATALQRRSDPAGRHGPRRVDTPGPGSAANPLAERDRARAAGGRT
jgi:hypothetical protein